MTDNERTLQGQGPRSDCDQLTEAAKGVERKLSRLQDAVTEMVTPEGDPDEVINEIVAELDVAPEVDDLRAALGMDADGSRTGIFEDRTRQDLEADAARAEEKAARRGSPTARPEDEPAEYRTWRTGP